MSGARSRQVQQDLRGQFADAWTERQTAIEADRGGAEQLSVLLRARVADYVELEALDAWMLDRLLEQGGPMTARGRTRALFTAWLSVRDRKIRLAQVIGLDRIAKPAPTLAEFLAAANAEPDASDLDPETDAPADDAPEPTETAS